jgi:hypothetical protein
VAPLSCSEQYNEQKQHASTRGHRRREIQSELGNRTVKVLLQLERDQSAAPRIFLMSCLIGK